MRRGEQTVVREGKNPPTPRQDKDKCEEKSVLAVQSRTSWRPSGAQLTANHRERGEEGKSARLLPLI